MSVSPVSRSSTVPADEELRLPRAPGVIRAFWARHPRLADILITLLVAILTLGPLAATTSLVKPKPAASAVAVVTIATLLTLAVVFKRRVWPLPLLIATIVTSLLSLTIDSTIGTVLLAVAVYGLAVYRSARACWIGVGITVGTIIAASALLLGAGVITFNTAANAAVGYLIMGLFGALIGINVGNRRRYLAAIIDRSRQLLVERDQHAQLAAAAERDRIAREMHDIVSHSLTVVVALSEGAAATPDQERARAASLATAATARSALTEMRSMLGVLREGGADAPLAPLEPVHPAHTVAAAQRAGAPVRLTVRGDSEVAPGLQFAIGRIVQEGVTNAMRHAKDATTIDVRLDYHPTQVVIVIDNDAAPTGAARTAGAESGYGLRGLGERVALLGGTIASAPDGRGRWQLRAELPASTEVAGEQIS